MPEGDVVLRTARRLDAALGGRVLLRSDFRWPSLATVDLSGRRVLGCAAAGKHLLLRVDGGLTVHSHLRMEGSWHVHPTGAVAAARRPGHAVRVVLVTADLTAIGHRLGMLDLIRTADEDRLVGHLGPDVLGAGWDPDDAVRRITADPARPIGEVLLDQRVLAGIGTFYMTEVCFVRGVRPWAPVREVPDPRALVDTAHRMMAANLDRTVQVTTGDARRGRENYVHARSGLPCRRCGTPIRVAAIGAAPIDRVAFWCPACQPGPVPTDTGGPQRPLGAGRRRAPGRAQGGGTSRGPAPTTYRRGR